MEAFNTLILVQNTNSEIRKAAEIKLKELENKDFIQFFIDLSNILAEETLDPEIRRLSGLVLKNKIEFEFENKNQKNIKKWLKISENKLKNEIKNNIIKTFNSSSKIVRRTASQVLAKIFQIELSNGEWKNIISFFKLYLEENKYQKNIYHSVLETIEFICQEANTGNIPKKNFCDLSEEILKIILYTLNQNFQTDSELKATSLNALGASLDLIQNILKNPINKDFIFRSILNQLTDSEMKIRVLTFETLDKMMLNYYRFFENYMAILFDLTLTTIKKDKERVVLQVIEFWSTIAEKEFEINAYSYQAIQEGRIPLDYSRNYIVKASFILPKLLFDCIKNRNKNEESDEWNCCNAAVTCLNLMSQAAPREIISQIIPLVEFNLLNEKNPDSNESGTLAFVAVFDGAGSKMLYGHVFKILFILLLNLENSIFNIRDLTSWTIGKICFSGSYFIRESLSRILRSLFININNSQKIYNFCWSLNGIFRTFSKEGLLDWSLNGIFSSIFKSVLIENQNKTRNELFEIICSAILNSCTRGKCFIFAILPFVFSKFKKSFKNMAGLTNFNNKSIQNHLCRIFNITIQKFGQKLNNLFIQEVIDFIFELIFSFIENDNDWFLEEEILICISSLAQSFQKKFSVHLAHWIRFLLRCILKNENTQIFSLALEIIGDICRIFDSDFNPYVEEVLTVLIKVLQNNKLDQKIKPQILGCLGDISFSAGFCSEKYLMFVIPIFKAPLVFSHKLNNLEDPDFFDWHFKLKESILEGLSSIFQNCVVKTTSSLFGEIFEKIKWIPNLIRNVIKEDRTNRITQLCIGLIGDLTLNYPLLKNFFFNQKWIHQILFECKSSQEDKMVTLGNWIRESMVN